MKKLLFIFTFLIPAAVAQTPQTPQYLPANNCSQSGGNAFCVAVRGAGVEDTNRPVVNTSLITAASGGVCGSGTDEVSKLCQLSVNADAGGFTGNKFVSASPTGPCTVNAATAYFFDPALTTAPLPTSNSTEEVLAPCTYDVTGEVDVPSGGSLTGIGTLREPGSPATSTWIVPGSSFEMNPSGAPIAGAVVNLGPPTTYTGTGPILGSVVRDVGINGADIPGISCLEGGFAQQQSYAENIELYQCTNGLDITTLGASGGAQNHYEYSNINIVPLAQSTTQVMTGMVIDSGGSGYDTNTSISVTGCTTAPSVAPVLTAGVLTGYTFTAPNYNGASCPPTGTTVTISDSAGSGATATAIVSNTPAPIGAHIKDGNGLFSDINVVSGKEPIVPPYGFTSDVNGNIFFNLYCESIDTCFAQGTQSTTPQWGNVVIGLNGEAANNPCFTSAYLPKTAVFGWMGIAMQNSGGCVDYVVDQGHNGGTIRYNGWAHDVMLYVRDRDQIISSNPQIETNVPIGIQYHDCASSGCTTNEWVYQYTPVINVNGYAQSFTSSNTADPIGIASNGDLDNIGTNSSTISRLGLISCLAGTSGSVTPGDYVVQGTTTVAGTAVVGCADSGSSSPPASGTTWGKWINDGGNGSDSALSAPTSGSITVHPTGTSSWTYKIVYSTYVDKTISPPYSISTTTGPNYLSESAGDYNEITGLSSSTPMLVWRTSVPYTAPTVTANCDTSSGKAVSLTITGGNAPLFPPTVSFSGGGFTTEPQVLLTVNGGTDFGYTFTSQGAGCTGNATGSVTESSFDTGYIYSNGGSATSFFDYGLKGDKTVPPASGQLAPRMDFYVQHWSQTPVRAGTWSISSATSVAVTFVPQMTAAPTSCAVTPSADPTATGTPFATSLATTGFTVNVANSGTLSGTYLCGVNNAN